MANGLANPAIVELQRAQQLVRWINSYVLGFLGEGSPTKIDYRKRVPFF